MYCDFKEFFGEQTFAVNLIDIANSRYGTTMRLHFHLDKEEEVLDCLLKAEIPIKKSILNSVSIGTPFDEDGDFKKTLDALAQDNLISQDLAHEIMTNFPNGFCGIKSLIEIPEIDLELRDTEQAEQELNEAIEELSQLNYR